MQSDSNAGSNSVFKKKPHVLIPGDLKLNNKKVENFSKKIIICITSGIEKDF